MNRPNILMIMTDQQRSDWLGCGGKTPVVTPNLDRLCNESMVFNRAVCNCPLCVPSRSSMTSGKYPSRIGTLENDLNYPLEHKTVYQHLRDAGYRVSVIGKTDLNKPDHFHGKNGNLPVMYQLGFTDPFDTEGKMNASRRFCNDHHFLKAEELPLDSYIGPYQKHLGDKGVLDRFISDYENRRDKPVWFSKSSALEADDFHDSFIGRKACDFLENITDESPWHLFVSFVGPHDPWDAPSEYYEKYRETEFPAAVPFHDKDKPEWIRKKNKAHSSGLRSEDIDEVKRQYSGMVTLIDEWIGKIISVLKKRNLADNTIIIFTSDHGEMLGDHGLYQKKVMYESSVRVPLIIKVPEMNSASGSSSALAELVDLYPTMLELCGVAFDKNSIDGESLLPVLRGEVSNHKPFQISQMENTRMIFDGRYKLIENFNDSDELYDLSNDREESNNIADTESDKVKSLKRELRKAYRISTIHTR